MNKKQIGFFKVIVIGLVINIILGALALLKQKIYWYGCGPTELQTPLQKTINNLHLYIHNIPRSSIFLMGFICAGIIFFVLSIIMED